jgi:hypothetical protein
MDLRYDGAAPIWMAAAMGSAAAPYVVSSVAASSLVVYAHAITMALDLSKFFTIAAAYGDPVPNFIMEVPSAKPRGFSLRVGDNGKMQLSLPVVGSKTMYTSAVNTNSTIAAATVDALANRVFRKQGTFRMNLQSAGSLVAADAQNVREVNITYARPVADGDHVFSQDYIIEPDDDGFAEVTAELVFARMTSANANSLVVCHPGGTHLKADFTFTGAAINSMHSYQFAFYLPALQITEWKAPVTGHNLVRPTATVALRQATTAPTGMAGITQPIRITIWNMNSATLI